MHTTPSLKPDTTMRYIQQLHEMLPELEDRFKVRSLAVFGSYVRGEQTTPSLKPDTTMRYIQQLHEMLPELEDRFKVRSLAVFGSYVRGEQTVASDLDVLIEFNETPGLQEDCLPNDRLLIMIEVIF
jgi:predicted nucleotidyltransferase